MLFLTLALLLGTCTVSRLTRHDAVKSGQAMSAPDPFAPSTHVLPGRADASGGAPADVPAAKVATAEAPVQPSPDARQPSRWYYVPRLGDGPGVIFSRTGGGWDYAFACTLASHTIEFIAVNVGDPAGFDRQYMRVGRVKMMMDATYSRDGQGTISTRLPARHPFFNAFAEPDPSLELQLLADRKVVIPIGPEVVRLVRDCGGTPVAASATKPAA